MVLSNRCPTAQPSGSEMRVETEPTRGRAQPGHVPQRFHRQCIEIAKQDADGEERDQQPHHERPQRRHAALQPHRDQEECGHEGYGEQGAPGQEAHAQPHDGIRVEDAGGADGKRGNAEVEREQVAGTVHSLEHLLRCS